jgi:molybdate transport system permease protein
LIPAILIAWVLARKEFWGKSLFETVVFLPLVLPPLYLVICYFKFLAIEDLGQYLAPLGLEFAFNWKGAVLASAVMGFPLLVQSIRLAIELVDQRLEMAAKTLGASPSGHLCR